MASVLVWMALLARSGKGARSVRREVSRAWSPVAAWQDWARGHPKSHPRGSLISARCAFDQDREVFALWQQGLASSWSGNRALVADELAVPVADVNALWRAMAEGARSRQTGSAKEEVVALPEGCREVWNTLNNTRPTTWNKLRKMCKGLTVDLERQVFTLEMLGWIRRLPGRAFLRN